MYLILRQRMNVNVFNENRRYPHLKEGRRFVIGKGLSEKSRVLRGFARRANARGINYRETYR